MDWPGLLKWSLNHSDGTKPANQNMMMSDEDKKWLVEAMMEYTFDEVKEMEKIMKAIVEKPKADADYSEFVTNELEALHDLTYSLDNNKNLCLIGGVDWLFETIFITESSDIIEKCALILAECCQNNQWIQNFCLRLHPLRLMNKILNSPKLSTKEACTSALSSFIRGLNIDIKRKFIDVDGVEYCLHILKDPHQSDRIKTKILSIVQDLLNYEHNLIENIDFLGKESYANTKGKIVNGKDTELMDLQVETEVPLAVIPEDNTENYFAYKDSVKRKLWEGEYLGIYEEVLGGVSNSRVDMRERYLGGLVKVILWGRSEGG